MLIGHRGQYSCCLLYIHTHTTGWVRGAADHKLLPVDPEKEKKETKIRARNQEPDVPGISMRSSGLDAHTVRLGSEGLELCFPFNFDSIPLPLPYKIFQRHRTFFFPQINVVIPSALSPPISRSVNASHETISLILPKTASESISPVGA